MYTDPILEEKWKIQKDMTAEANFNIAALFAHMNDSMPRIIRQYNLNITYSTRTSKFNKD